jgi:uncharacterized protein (DUF362 family)
MAQLLNIDVGQAESMVKVCIQKSENPDVRRALDLIDFVPSDCELVIIKADLCSTSGPREEATDTGLIEQVLKIYDGHAKCAVVGTSGEGTNVRDCFERTGVSELCERYNAETMDLAKDVKIPIEGDGSVLKNFKMPRTLLKADLFINMPKMKTSEATTVSLGLMNVFDLIPGKKVIYRPKIAESICDLLAIRKPDMNIMDGVVGIEGSGTRRRAKQMDLVLTCRDIVAIDTIACRIMGINPVNVEHVFRAGYSGLGEYAEKNIRIVGRSVDEVRDRFEI